MSKILVVDDEPNLLHSLAYSLRRDGHEVVTAVDGEEALREFDAAQPDVVVLDLMLPKLDGLEVCRRLRLAGPVPILMLTARDSEIDRVVGLELGADDYVTKPFSMRELQARVKALLRRAGTMRQVAEQGDILRSGSLEVDRQRRRTRVDGRDVDLKPKEFELLTFLLANRGIVFSRETLLQRVWGYDYPGITRTVDAHMRALREKLGDDVQAPRWLETVRGVGYRLREG